jgi:WD40 repeat protein
MAPHGLDLFRKLAGKSKRVLAGLVRAGLREVIGCVPGVGLAVRLVREIADHGTDRLLDAAADLDELKQPGEVYSGEQLAAIDAWLGTLSESLGSLRERLEELLDARDDDPWDRVAEGVQEALERRDDLAEEFGRVQRAVGQQALSLHRVEQHLSEFFHVQKGVRLSLEEIKTLLLALPLASEWADFRRADPECVRLLLEADRLILAGDRDEGFRHLLALLQRRGVGSTVIARHFGLHKLADGRLDEALAALEVVGDETAPSLTEPVSLLSTTRSRPAGPVWRSLPRGLVVGKKYRIEDEVGRGGMASVYRVVGVDRISRGKVFALKVPAPGLIDDGAVADRFVREIELGVRLTEAARDCRARTGTLPPVVATHDYVVFDDPHSGQELYGLVLDFIQGHSLARHIAERRAARRPFTPQEVLALLGPVCAALDFAHGQQPAAIHRDVKPLNVMVADDGRVLLMDFGIARVLDDRLGDLTRTASVVGTPLYMPPELFNSLQPREEAVDIDVYMAGNLLLELLTFSPNGLVDPQLGYPAAWLDLIGDAMNRIPAKRPQTIRAFRERLESVGPGTDGREGEAPADPGAAGSAGALPSRRPAPAPATHRLGQPGPRPLTAAVSLATLRGHGSYVRCVAFSPDGQILATGSHDNTARLWRANDGRWLASLEGHSSAILALAFSPDGQLLATGSNDHTARLWQVSSGRCLALLQGHRNTVPSVAFSPDGRTLATGSTDSTVRLWQVSDSSCLAVLAGHCASVGSVTFSPDGQLLATASNDHTARLFRVADGCCVATLHGHTNSVWSAVFSPDGQTLATCSHDHTARLFGIADGTCLATLRGHGNSVGSVAFSPNGQVVATASNDHTARLWWAADGRCLATLQGYGSAVLSLAFSPDGQLLATGGGDNTARLWRVSDGRCLAALEGHGGGVGCVAFSPDGQLLATGSGDNTARLWLLHAEDGQTGWSSPAARTPPQPRVSLVRAGNGQVRAGDLAWVQVTVENQGGGDVVWLWAEMQSASPLLRGFCATIGRLRPGEKAERCVAALLPADTPAGPLLGELIFHEGNGYAPAARPVAFTVEPLPRPDFPVTWRLINDGSGSSHGSGDGRPRPGEFIDVEVSLTNQTGEDLDWLFLTLRSVAVPEGVKVTGPRHDVGLVRNGSRAEGRVGFRVDARAAAGVVKLELRVELRDGRTFAVVPVETRVE